MPTFWVTVRVELHKDDARTQAHSPTASEYGVLHKEMRKRAFRRFYEGASKHKFKLPPGEYMMVLEATTSMAARDHALGKAKEAAAIATSEKRFSLLVNAAGSITSHQLEIIVTDPDE